MIPKRMIEKKKDVAKLAKFYLKEWQNERRGRRNFFVDLNHDVGFVKKLIELLNTMSGLSRKEKEKIVKIGRPWLLTNGVLMCSVINYTEEEIKDLTTSEIQAMVGEVSALNQFDNLGNDVLKKLYKTRPTETVEALKLLITNNILSTSFHDLRNDVFKPSRLIKLMVGKEFCEEMGLGGLKVSKNGQKFKTLEEELNVEFVKEKPPYINGKQNMKILEEAEQNDEYCGDQPWFDEDRICQEMGCDEVYVGDGMWWDNVNKRHYCED